MSEERPARDRCSRNTSVGQRARMVWRERRRWLSAVWTSPGPAVDSNGRRRHRAEASAASVLTTSSSAFALFNLAHLALISLIRTSPTSFERTSPSPPPPTTVTNHARIRIRCPIVPALRRVDLNTSPHVVAFARSTTCLPRR
ncbi:hypothetical protein V8D89_006487 [Ganoderma adspersum]